jgi:hypothetical protein
MNRVVQFLAVFVCMGVLLGCETVGIKSEVERKSEHQTALNSWVGHHIDEWVKAQGYPQRSLVAPNGNKVHVWMRSKDVVTQRRVYQKGETADHTIVTDSGKVLWGTSTTPGKWVTKDETINYWCNMYVEVDELNRIVQIRTEGNNCY